MAEFRSDAIYTRIVTHYRTLIDSGELQRGDRLPAVPALAREEGVTEATARKALDVLKEERYVRANYEGHFVWLSGPARLWQRAEDAFNELERAGQNPQLVTGDLGPCITGTDGGLRWNGDAWERMKSR